MFRLLGLHPGPDIAAAAAASLAPSRPSKPAALLAELTRAHLLDRVRPQAGSRSTTCCAPTPPSWLTPMTARGPGTRRRPAP